MKLQTIIVCIILFTLFPLFAAGGDNGVVVNNTCKNYLEKTAFYHQSISKDKGFYQKVRSTTMDTNSEEVTELVSEAWTSTTKFKFQNQYMELYQDQQTNVMILNDSRVIILRDASSEKGNNVQPFKNGSDAVDQLILISSEITCSVEQERVNIYIKFKDLDLLTPNPYSKATLFIDVESGRLLATEYVSSETNIIEKQEILVSHPIAGDPFPDDAIEEVTSTGRLSPAYNDFQLKDLRSKTRK